MREYTTKTGIIIVKANEPGVKPAGPTGNITLDVTIRDAQTGESRLYSYESYPADYPRDTIEYMWTEGNYACDCNRGLFFYGGDFDGSCGDGRFEVDRAVIRETGEVLCENGEWRIDA